MLVNDVGGGSQTHRVEGPSPPDEQRHADPPEQAGPPEPVSNEATLRAEVRQYGEQQREQLNNRLEAGVSEDDQSLPTGSIVAGATTGGSAGTLEVSEQQVRNYQPITVRVDPAHIPPGVDPAQFREDFLSNVERDLDRLAPGTTIERRPTNSFYSSVWDSMYGTDVYGVVRRAENRVPGHEQGYRLIDQLVNNPNQVSIRYQGNRAYAIPDDWGPNPQASRAVGTPYNPGSGTNMEAIYDPYMTISLPVRNANGTISPVPADPAVILGHELTHTIHGQRGTLDARLASPQSPDHFFRDGDNHFREYHHPGVFTREEFRTVGFDGFRFGSEPTENSLRREVGINEPRATYMENVNYGPVGGPPANGYEPLTPFQARTGRALQMLDNAGTVVIDGVTHSGRSAVIGGGVAFVTSTYNAFRDGQNFTDAAGDIAAQTALGAGTGVAEEVIERAISGTPAVTSGATNSWVRVAANQARGAAVAGAVTNTAFAVYDQWDNLQNDATRSQAIGVIAGEAAVGAASGLAGAYAGAMAGAAIGSIVPGVGTVVGGVVGFAAGAAVGYLTDQGLRGLGVNRAIASGVTATVDFVGQIGSQAKETVSNIANGVSNFFGGAARTLASVFG